MATDHRDKQTGGHSADHSGARDAPRGRRDIERQSFAPFSIMRQGLDEMERWVGRWGWRERMGDWSPAIEAFQRGNEFVIRVEAPGMTRQDLQVDVSDDAVTVRGERREDRKEERDGMFWTERSYGSFARVIPLPAGAIEDSAKATFKNGVLEIVMQAPSPETRRGRRIDISGSGEEEGKKA
jgi:HSP20 family molecular chaperone IbpA